jgi:hypothetical protein
MHYNKLKIWILKNDTRPLMKGLFLKDLTILMYPMDVNGKIFDAKYT